MPDEGYVIDVLEFPLSFVSILSIPRWRVMQQECHYIFMSSPDAIYMHMNIEYAFVHVGV